MQATQTLPEAAKDTIRSEFDRAESADPIVLWWDDGNYLEDIIKQACDELGVHLKVAEGTPLELRAAPVDGEQVWYVPHVKEPEDTEGDFDWFRDVEHTGGEVEMSIEDLTIHAFERGQLDAWELKTTTRSDDPAKRREIARILHDQLTGGQLPTLEQLRTRIVTGGYTDPVAFVLENGWGDIDDSPDTIEQMQDLLTSEGVDAVASEDEPAGIVAATRRWGVAEWLIHAGVDAERFPTAFRAETAGDHDLPELKSLLNNTTSAGLIADRYLGEATWPDIVADVDEPWELADCLVDAALERRLWEAWHASFDAGDYEACLTRAEERYDALLGSEDFRGTYRGAYGPDSPWTQTWEQAAEVARLAHQLETWDERATDDVVSLYADPDDGTWQIDNAVLNLVVAGAPESDLPSDHPAVDTLDDLRTHLQSEYVEYLEALGDRVTETVEAGAPFVDEDHSYQFFTKESDGLESGQTVALFVIDALRLDLARRLADELRDYVATLPADAPEFAVDEDVWLGTLPSETEFGKAALTPGEIQMFDVSLVDGELQPLRNNRKVNTNRRNSLLHGDGWTVTRDTEDGWQSTRVAYFKNDLDDIGEKELSDLEAMLARRVDSLAEFIGTKLEQGEWDQAYVLTDHGFVLLPDSASPEKISRPMEASDSGRRWIAGEDVDADSPGVLLDSSSRLGYLDANVSVLASPLKRFKKQGLGDARFYHGGLLPQEFVLDFISITQG
ncbi:BREX-5 system phosphatase PglZ [Haloarcula argentinensis]|uniref:BREX-5 system phosphatase PglZ n=1 Tax=Haloarcula argentinensis TaxID=43776 RepID=A0ABU2F4Y0_HALAR|nr:BREX-5 system phosphatase PglZ [Haloarcula argentinensis]EMA17926.1 PglZ domain-containing protein [Haloarcula argentinensis DSM 12282]MDS0255618.1 BREX-5 system phosphatase PglZ [Haloarcula argentinensis]